MRKSFYVPLAASAVALLLLSGCTMGFDRVAAERRLDKISLDDVSAKPNTIKTPLKVALFMDIERMISPTEFDESIDWSPGDVKLVISYLENLEELGYIKDYFIIPDNPTFVMQDMNYLLGEARKQDADVLVSVRGVMKVNRYFNPSAILDLTILLAWLVPGSNCDADFVMRMDMWNAKERDSILTVRGESFRRISEPTFLMDPNDAIMPAKREALKKVLAEFRKKCRQIKPATEKQ